MILNSLRFSTSIRRLYGIGRLDEICLLDADAVSFLEINSSSSELFYRFTNIVFVNQKKKKWFWVSSEWFLKKVL